MGLLGLLLRDPLAFALVAVPILYSIICHELAHGWVAYRMGDQTAKWQGRLSLNPLSHLDPVGTLMLFPFGFGRVKPVPVNFDNLSDMLAAFNLIPIPPLDRSKILVGFASAPFQYFLLRLEPFGFLIIIGLLYLGALDPLIDFFRWCILPAIQHLLP